MTRRLVLEAFDEAAAGLVEPVPSGGIDASETARLQGYDEGYKSGWDDALQKTLEDGTRIGAEFARNLRDLGFTYEEARAHVLTSLRGFLTELSDVFLPELIDEAMGPVLLECLIDLADESATAPILVRVSSNEAERLERFLADQAVLPFRIVAEPSLAEGQAYLRLGAEERSVDLTEPLERVREALSGLNHATERTLDEKRSA